MSKPSSTSTSLSNTPAKLQPLWNLLGPLLALVSVILIFMVADSIFADGTFSTFRNLRTVTVQTCVVAVAALGMTLIIIAGGIDLSAGTALALSATILAWGLREDVAFLMQHGTNFQTASITYDEAHKSYAQAVRDRDESKRKHETDFELFHQQTVEYWAKQVQKRHQALVTVTNAKLTQVESSGNSARIAAFKAKQQLLLNDPVETDPGTPPFQANREWLMNVPNHSWTAFLAVGLGIFAGMLTGLINGILISKLGVVPFIITLGTMTIYLGVGNLLADNVPIRPALDTVPDWLSGMVSNKADALWLGFPSGVWIALLLALMLSLVLRYSVFGRYVFALGSNEATARLCGINITWNKIWVYTLAGAFVGIAGAFQFSRLSTGNPMSGIGLELEIIAAVVIGGGSLNGGRGSVLGTLAGAAIMAVITSGCTQLGLTDQIQRIIIGLFIIGAVTLDQWRQRRLVTS